MKGEVSLQRRIMWVTVVIVALIFGAVMTVLWVTVRHAALNRAVKSEQIDLNRNADLLSVMIEEGIPVENVRQVAQEPWDDGGAASYVVVAPGEKLPEVPAGMRLLTADVPDASGETIFTVAELLPESSLTRPAMHTVPYMVVFSVLTILVLVAAINYAIGWLSRPEVKRQQRLDAELDIARRVQQGLIGSPSLRTGLPAEVVTVMTPAKEVAGDMCVCSEQEGYLNFMIGDVSGKGIPAAMFMAVTTRLYSSLVSQGRVPAQIMQILADTLCQENPTGMFTTAIVGRMNLSDGKTELCNAGHMRPIIIDDTGARLLDLPVNIPLGVMEGFEYEAVTVSMKSGSHVLLYTDGVTEAENRRHDQLGEAALVEGLSASGGDDAAQLCETVLNLVKKHVAGAEQTDDIALIDVHYTATVSVQLKPELESLRELAAIAETQRWPDKLTLAAEEALVNVINHSHASSIGLTARAEGNVMTIAITDDGTEFDPTSYSADDAEPTDDLGPDMLLNIGGKGIGLMRSLCSKIEYQRIDNNNKLTLTYEL